MSSRIFLSLLTFFYASAFAGEFFAPKVYDKAGAVVRYYEALDDGKFMVADFKNKYWVDGAREKPSFYPKDGAWKLITRIVTSFDEDAIKAGKSITSTIFIPEYKQGSVFVGGSITRIEDECFKSAWWTKASPLDDSQVWSKVECPSESFTLPELSKSGTTSQKTDSKNEPKPQIEDKKDETPKKQDFSECDLDSIPEWNKNGVYLAGNVVKYEGKIYKTRWWSKGDIPSKKVKNIWDKPWVLLDKCPSLDLTEEVKPKESPSGMPSDFDLDPVVIDTTKASDDELKNATKEATEQTQKTDSPAVPPVVIDETPAKAPVAPKNIPTALPKDGYEFLRLVTDEDWDWMFPLRSGKLVSKEPCEPGEFLNCGGGVRNDGSGDVFTLDNFIKAVLAYNAWAEANGYKQFLNEGTIKQQAEEFLIFWAKSSRETSGSWANAPEPWIVTQKIGNETITAWKGGLYWVEEVGYSTDPKTGMSSAINYVDASSTLYPPAPGRSYYGRGIIQLSWNYNYGAFSYWLYDNNLFRDVIDSRDKLLKFPNLVADNGALSIMSGIWFWMTPQGAKPSAHDVVYGDVYNISKSTQEMGLPQSNTLSSDKIPVAKGDTTDESVFAYRLGTVINIVNGGLECNKAAKWHGGPVQRVFYYDAYASYFNHKYNLNANRISSTKASSPEAWLTKVSDSSPKDLQSATCYNQKSYYGW